MIRLVTFSDHNMSISMALCIRSALKHGVNQADGYRPNILPKEIRSHAIMSQPRGAGYWIWKPFIIMEALKAVKYGEIVVYSDAGIEFINHVNHITERMNDDFFFFSNGHRHVEWCKMDSFIHSNVTPNWEQRQVQASVIFMKKTEAVLELIQEWQRLCLIPGLIDDSPSHHANWPTFAEHRHDQAILTCLQIKYGYKLHWWPTQYSNHIKAGFEEDNYPALFRHHRLRDHEWPK